jgi:hypothetical protein
MKLSAVVVALVLFLLSTSPVFAQGNEFVTIVNPVRIATYTKDPVKNISAQYQEIATRKLAATWLLTYQSMENASMAAKIKTFNKQQELGIFMEVTPDLAQAAGVNYHKTDSWHRAASLFLIGYSQSDRIKLIDTVFKSFKEQFGDYPKSVGAWWIDSYSLSYMHKAYGVSGYMGCADQTSTDSYGLWGQPWSLPYYPSLLHSGIPASDLKAKLDVVKIQWAARDPINAYAKDEASKYSTQDYWTIGLSDDYFEKFLNLYAMSHMNPFGQITVGLESDLDEATYQQGPFMRQIEYVKNLQEQQKTAAVTMRDFSNWYRTQFPDLSPPAVIDSEDFLSTNKRTIWYQSPKYRFNVVIDPTTKNVTLRDLRTYHSDIKEPFFDSIIDQQQLQIITPFIIDDAVFLNGGVILANKEIAFVTGSNHQYSINFIDKSSIVLAPDEIRFVGLNQLQSKFINQPVKVSTTKNDFSIVPNTDWIKGSDGYTFKDITVEGNYFLQQRKIKFGLFGLGILFLIMALFLIVAKLPAFIKLGILVVTLVVVGASVWWWYDHYSKMYFVSQSEIDVLHQLALLPKGKVLVLNKPCLQCKWDVPYQPAALANRRDYVHTLTHDQLLYNTSVFDAASRESARVELKNSGANYIYLVKYGDYAEKTPFSPGDLGIELVYSNANAELWQMK